MTLTHSFPSAQDYKNSYLQSLKTQEAKGVGLSLLGGSLITLGAVAFGISNIGIGFAVAGIAALVLGQLRANYFNAQRNEYLQMEVLAKNWKPLSEQNFQDVITECNKDKNEKNPTALIILGANDTNGTLYQSELIYNIRLLAKQHKVVLRVIDDGDKVGPTINKVKGEENHPVDMLILYGHGTRSFIEFGDKKANPYSRDKVKVEDFEGLAVNGKIVVHACETGKDATALDDSPNIAQVIASKARGRGVIAPKERFNPSVLFLIPALLGHYVINECRDVPPLENRGMVTEIRYPAIGEEGPVSQLYEYTSTPQHPNYDPIRQMAQEGSDRGNPFDQLVLGNIAIKDQNDVVEEREHLEAAKQGAFVPSLPLLYFDKKKYQQAIHWAYIMLDRTTDAIQKNRLKNLLLQVSRQQFPQS